jgi:hypothetical protein
MTCSAGCLFQNSIRTAFVTDAQQDAAFDEIGHITPKGFG